MSFALARLRFTLFTRVEVEATPLLKNPDYFIIGRVDTRPGEGKGFLSLILFFIF